MNKVQYHQRIIKQLYLAYAPQISSLFVRNYCIEGKSGETITNAKEQDSSDEDPESINSKQICQSIENIEIEKNLANPRCSTFTSLLRHSKFIDVNIKYFILLHNLT